jgi:hypothetical protein
MSFVVDETAPLGAQSSEHSVTAAATHSPQEVQRMTDAVIGSTLLQVPDSELNEQKVSSFMRGHLFV